MAVDSICVIGLGYIGLPTAAIFADRGIRVHGVDVSDKHVDAVNAGKLPFVEEGLGEVVERNVAQGRLSAQKDTPPARVYVVAVPTPFAEGHKVDTSYIDAAAAGIAPQLVGDELIILESTSPPGTTEHLAQVILDRRPDLSLDGAGDTQIIHFAHAPERVLPGRIMVELVTNDRIIGGMTPEATRRAVEVYRIFCEGELLETDAKTAEMAKLTENSFRDVNIAFANELSIIAGELGIDVWELIELANHHPRVNILQPGPGVGGHCIAVDPWFIVSSAPESSRLIHTARTVNDSKPQYVIDQVAEAARDIEQPVVAALGLAFKPDIDDLRESPSLAITKELAGQMAGASIIAVEPYVEELPAALQGLDNVEFSTDTEEAIRRADIVVLLVDHKPFKDVDRAVLEGKQVIDTRGMWR